MDSNREKDNEQLRQWMKDSGCLIHPAIQIPAYFNGVQGIGTKQSLPHKTVIMAIPSKLVITVPRCYSDPQLKSLFKSNDDLFDYQSDEDAQFNILCVFLMYHKLHMDRSPWSVYLKTIAQPETGVSWPDRDLSGLNKSVIQQILHVRRQCKKVQQTLCKFLAKSKQFKHLSYQQIVQLFKICYPTVLTRCFGYYFSTACMIPVADLMNHGCQTIDHQLIHLNFERELQFDQTYNPKQHKLNCQILGLPKAQKRTMPFRLDFLLKNQLIENDMAVLGKIRRNQIDSKIYKLLNDKLNSDYQYGVEKLDFCEEQDQQDNDTDEDQEYSQTKSLEHIKAAQKQQMIEFQKYYLQVQKLGDVEKRIKQQYGEEELEDNQQKQSNSTQQPHPQKQEKQQKNEQPKQKQEETEKEKEKDKQDKSQIKQKKEQQQSTQIKKQQSSQNTQTQITQKQPTQQSEQKKLSQKAKINTQIFPNQNMYPVQMADDSSQQKSCSQEEQWCLDQTCYFTMSTHTPVGAGCQLFNSYGSRTNKFLLVWYGFTYPDNLYDSVTLRLQANFPPSKPKAKDIVLDTYVGGQGLCFKKNQQQQVRPEEVSRQFRLKRTRLPLEFMMFLRLFLTNYYQGADNYKVLCTVPSSLEFQLQMLHFLKEIIEHIYQRYPLSTIQALKQLLNSDIDSKRKSITNFKIIYLEEQRKILDATMEAIDAAILVVKRLENTKQFTKQIYKDIKIQVIRKIREYLIELKTNFNYIMYSQVQQIEGDEQNLVN